MCVTVKSCVGENRSCFGTFSVYFQWFLKTGQRASDFSSELYQIFLLYPATFFECSRLLCAEHKICNKSRDGCLASLASASPAETTTTRRTRRCTQWQEKLLSAYKTVDSERDSAASDLGVALFLFLHCLSQFPSLHLSLSLPLPTLAASAYVVNVFVPLTF